MSEVKIIYNGYPKIIQIQLNELLKEIFKKFKIKIKAENKELNFLYNGEIIKDDNMINILCMINYKLFFFSYIYFFPFNNMLFQ